MKTDAFECSPGVRWAVETRGVLLLHPEHGALCSAPYPAAAVWDFISRGVAAEKAAGLLRHIGGFADAKAAADFAGTCAVQWLALGLLRLKGGSDV